MEACPGPAGSPWDKPGRWLSAGARRTSVIPRAGDNGLVQARGAAAGVSEPPLVSERCRPLRATNATNVVSRLRVDVGVHLPGSRSCGP